MCLTQIFRSGTWYPCSKVKRSKLSQGREKSCSYERDVYRRQQKNFQVYRRKKDIRANKMKRQLTKKPLFGAPFNWIFWTKLTISSTYFLNAGCTAVQGLTPQPCSVHKEWMSEVLAYSRVGCKTRGCQTHLENPLSYFFVDTNEAFSK